MCTDKKMQDEFVDQMVESIKSWFDDITEDATVKYSEDVYTEGELDVRLDTIKECSDFMERIFIKIGGSVAVAPLVK